MYKFCLQKANDDINDTGGKLMEQFLEPLDNCNKEGDHDC